MNKIYIVGIVASGKTTLAKKLSEHLHIPWFELDCIIYCNSETGRYKRSPEQQLEVIHDIDKNENWIIEGTYRISCHCLFELADTIIFLDPPLWKRKLRIFKRYIKQQLRIEKCHYKSNLKMLKLMYKWTNDFEVNRNKFEAMLEQYEYKILKLSVNDDLSIAEFL